jgi:hypothetical protein
VTQRAIVGGVERHFIDLPHRYKTATCDACGHEQHEQGMFYQVRGLLEQEGWRFAENGDLTCPRCVEAGK